ncbi:hypothetical protein AB0P21_40175 [Kribbella sp. NPDC056861]|uniref:hypothetical protein n=1 Tax=Kribbella sp. NPDC056861 TaxID=3154857 RepID=UPI0034211DE5
MTYFLIIVLTLAGAWADARGFTYAGQVWVDDRMAWPPLGAALVAYAAGLICYVAALRFLARVADVGVGLQAAGWYVATMVGLALITGDAGTWSWTDRLLALASITTLTALIARQS